MKILCDFDNKTDVYIVDIEHRGNDVFISYVDSNDQLYIKKETMKDSTTILLSNNVNEIS